MSRRGTAVGGIDESGPMSFLTRAQDRALRAKAWRYVRRINPQVARRVWRKHRTAQQWKRLGIVGVAGHDIGRGGRTTVYYVDGI